MNTLIWIEIESGQIIQSSIPALAQGSLIAKGYPTTAICVSETKKVTKEVRQQLEQLGVEHLLYYVTAQKEHLLTRQYTDILVDAMKRIQPQLVLAAATDLSNDVLAGLKVRMQMGLVTNATEIDNRENRLIVRRPSNDGNEMENYECTSTMRQLVTLRAEVVEMPERKNGLECCSETIMWEASDRSERVKLLAEKKEKMEVTDIAKAEYIVAGGRGMGGQSGFNEIKQLAKRLSAAVATSRPNVDEGWIDKAYQVGLSGKTVTPKLYLAFGISGSAHHIVGMEHSQTILAVNVDHNAPVFDLADVGIVGDAHEVIRAMLDILTED